VKKLSIGDGRQRGYPVDGPVEIPGMSAIQLHQEDCAQAVCAAVIFAPARQQICLAATPGRAMRAKIPRDAGLAARENRRLARVLFDRVNEALRRGLLQGAVDRGVDVVQIAAQTVDDCDDGESNARRDQSVFDCRGARIVGQEFLNNALQRRLLMIARVQVPEFKCHDLARGRTSTAYDLKLREPGTRNSCG
jgi:hypothetical protein